MIRHPLIDLYTGAFLAMGGPIALMLPQRIFLAMLTAALEAPCHLRPRRTQGPA